MIGRIWRSGQEDDGGTRDEYLKLMRTVAIPDHRATPGNVGGSRTWGGSKATAHFLMVTYGFGVEAPRAIGATQSFQVPRVRVRERKHSDDSSNERPQGTS